MHTPNGRFWRARIFAATVCNLPRGGVGHDVGLDRNLRTVMEFEDNATVDGGERGLSTIILDHDFLRTRLFQNDSSDFKRLYIFRFCMVSRE